MIQISIRRDRAGRWSAARIDDARPREQQPISIDPDSLRAAMIAAEDIRITVAGQESPHILLSWCVSRHDRDQAAIDLDELPAVIDRALAIIARPAADFHPRWHVPDDAAYAYEYLAGWPPRKEPS